MPSRGRGGIWWPASMGITWRSWACRCGPWRKAWRSWAARWPRMWTVSTATGRCSTGGRSHRRGTARRAPTCRRIRDRRDRPMCLPSCWATTQGCPYIAWARRAVPLPAGWKRGWLRDEEAAGEFHLHGVVKAHWDGNQLVGQDQGHVSRERVRRGRDEDNAQPSGRRALQLLGRLSHEQSERVQAVPWKRQEDDPV